MRFDKLTTKFQQALQEAQSIAVGHDNQFIEPQHLLLALLEQEDGSTVSLLQRAGVNVAGLKSALQKAIEALPQVQGTGGEVQIGRDLANLLNLTDREAQNAVILTSPPRCSCSRSPRTRARRVASRGSTV